MRLGLLIAFVTCVTACATRLEHRPTSADIRAQVEARGATFVRLYEAGEVDSVALMFSQQAHLIPPGVPAVIGREAIREHVAQGLALGSWTQEVVTQSVASCDSLAIERGRFTIRFQPGERSPAGITAFNQTGDYLIHWQRANGTWVIKTYMGSTDGPPTPAP